MVRGVRRNAGLLVSNCGTDVNTPRRICLCVRIAKNLFTKFAHDALVEVKCRKMRFLRSIQPSTFSCSSFDNTILAATRIGFLPSSRHQAG